MALKNITKLILNFIGGGRINIPLKPLKSVRIDGNISDEEAVKFTPQELTEEQQNQAKQNLGIQGGGGNQMHILEVLGEIYESSDLDAGLDLLKLDGNSVTSITELLVITPLNTIIKYNDKLYGVNYVDLSDSPFITISAGCTYLSGQQGQYNWKDQVLIRYQDDMLFYIEIFN